MDVDTTPKSGSSSMVPVALGLIGIALGAAALYFSLSDRTAATKASSTLASTIEDVKATAESASKTAADLDGRIKVILDANNNLGASIKQMHTEFQGVINQVGDSLKKDGDQIATLTDTVSKLSAPPAKASAASSASGGASGPAAAPGQAGIYAIQDKDTLASIAKKFGVSLSAIEAANPDINPNRMRIGQKINIPAPGAPAAPTAASTPSTPAATPATGN